MHEIGSKSVRCFLERHPRNGILLQSIRVIVQTQRVEHLKAIMNRSTAIFDFPNLSF